MKVFLTALVALTLATSAYARSPQQDREVLKQMSDNIVAPLGDVPMYTKVNVLSQFIATKMKPVNARVGLQEITATSDTPILDRIMFGSGWCNHQAEAFIVLASFQHIKTRLVFLMNKDATASHHSIAEAWVDGRWVIVDPMFNIDIKNAEGLPISRDDVRIDPTLLWKAKLIKKRADFETHEAVVEWLKVFEYPAYIVYEVDEAGKYTRIDAQEGAIAPTRS